MKDVDVASGQVHAGDDDRSEVDDPLVGGVERLGQEGLGRGRVAALDVEVIKGELHSALRCTIPRSRLFAMALEEFLRNYRQQNVTERLNAVYRDLSARQSRDVMDAGLESIRNLTRDDSW